MDGPILKVVQVLWNQRQEPSKQDRVRRRDLAVKLIQGLLAGALVQDDVACGCHGNCEESCLVIGPQLRWEES